MNIRNMSILLVFVLVLSSCNLPTNQPVQNDGSETPPPSAHAGEYPPPP